MLKDLTLLLLLAGAVWMDLCGGKVSNRLIVMGAGLGIMFQVLENGVMGIFYFLINFSIPVIFLYLLFFMHVLGAGDIKLFSIMGVFLCRKDLLHCMLLAFFIGGGISFIRLWRSGEMFPKMKEFMQYIQTVAITKEITVYRSVRRREDVICFTVPILAGYLCYLLGVNI